MVWLDWRRHHLWIRYWSQIIPCMCFWVLQFPQRVLATRRIRSLDQWAYLMKFSIIIGYFYYFILWIISLQKSRLLQMWVNQYSRSTLFDDLPPKKLYIIFWCFSEEKSLLIPGKVAICPLLFIFYYFSLNRFLRLYFRWVY